MLPRKILLSSRKYFLLFSLEGKPDLENDTTY